MIIHVDMDAFFASVEQLDNPELIGKPVIVGGTSNRGVVAASSYEARKFGVYSAMPIFQARQKCPQGIYVRPRGYRYKEISIQVMSILSSFTPVFQQVSIDEAFLDITGCESIFGTPYEIGMKIKQKIKSEAHLICSVGIAPLKFLAKIASDMDKPDGLTYISPEDMHLFIEALPVRKISGVGKQTAGHLGKMGIVTLGDVKKYTRETLLTRLGKYGNRLYELANGIDRSTVDVYRPVKSISTEETLAADMADKDRLKKYLLKHSEDVGRQLRKKGCKARTVTLKVKHSDFKQVTRQTKMPCYTFSSEKIYQAAVILLDEYFLRKPVRLIGVGVSDFDDKKQAVQMELFAGSDDGVEKWEKVDSAVDAIAEKFGKDVITKAGLKGN
ncbi:MAG: DNA polymerase IV [Desulfobacteraceae bacterium]|jgi:DNA polymerase-4|nr:DNA polymerase IV [Desulfobacteraceae bacterium]